MDLLVTVRVQEHQVGLIVHTALSSWQNVMDMPSGLLGDQLAAVGTSSFLCLPKAKQSLSPFEAVFQCQAEPLFEVWLIGGVEGVRLAFDLDVASDRGVAGMGQLHQLHRAIASFDLCAEHPVAHPFGMEVALLDPSLGFLGVSPASPLP